MPIPDVQGRAHNQVVECKGPAEEVSTTVAAQNVRKKKSKQPAVVRIDEVGGVETMVVATRS